MNVKETTTELNTIFDNMIIFLITSILNCKIFPEEYNLHSYSRQSTREEEAMCKSVQSAVRSGFVQLTPSQLSKRDPHS